LPTPAGATAALAWTAEGGAVVTVGVGVDDVDGAPGPPRPAGPDLAGAATGAAAGWPLLPSGAAAGWPRLPSDTGWPVSAGPRPPATGRPAKGGAVVGVVDVDGPPRPAGPDPAGAGAAAGAAAGRPRLPSAGGWPAAAGQRPTGRPCPVSAGATAAAPAEGGAGVDVDGSPGPPRPFGSDRSAPGRL